MHLRLNAAIHEALESSEAVAAPEAHTRIADAARYCVKAQLDVETPDPYVVHRCLRALYREMRQTAQVDDYNQAAFEQTLAMVKSCVEATGPKVDHLYAWIAPKGRFLKAVIQMLIGALAVVRLGAQMWHGNAWWNPRFPSAKHGLGLIGIALAAATVVELAYTLFTDGPDEVLDPLMLGISAFLIIELGTPTTQITWGTGIGLLLAAIALSLLFLIRERFIEDAGPVPPFWWRRLWTKRDF